MSIRTDSPYYVRRYVPTVRRWVWEWGQGHPIPYPTRQTELGKILKEVKCKNMRFNTLIKILKEILRQFKICNYRLTEIRDLLKDSDDDD